MELILLERIENLGQMGDVVNVKPGYARNYLLPGNKAISATPENKKQFEKKRIEFEARNLETKNEAETIGGKLNGNHVIMIRQAGESGQLYGSVNAREVANGLAESGYKISRRQVSLERPIKSVGLHTIKIALHPEVTVTVTANVARSEDEAVLQEKTGKAVITADLNDQLLDVEATVETDNGERLQAKKTSDKHKNSEEGSSGMIAEPKKADGPPEN